MDKCYLDARFVCTTPEKRYIIISSIVYALHHLKCREILNMNSKGYQKSIKCGPKINKALNEFYSIHKSAKDI